MMPPERSPRPVHPTVVWLASYAWRIIVIAAVLVGVLWLLGQVLVTLLALVIAAMLSRALVPVGDRLRARGLPDAACAAIAVLGFLLTVGTAVGLIGVAVVNQADDIGPTISQAIDDVETWLVDDSPFPIEQEDIDKYRRRLSDGLGSAVAAGGGGGVASSVFAAVEGVFAVFLGLIITFFIVKDGHRFVSWATGRVRPERQDVARRMGARAWESLGGYLRGAAILGLVEGTIIGITLQVAGAELAIPMAALTFIGAFVPLLGAVVAGIIAVLVALATAGLGAAVAVAVVAVIVQQFDNDILAPWIYGRALSLHPVTILVAITAGGSLFGLLGTFLAVPVTAIVINVWSEANDGDDVPLVAEEDRKP